MNKISSISLNEEKIAQNQIEIKNNYGMSDTICQIIIKNIISEAIYQTKIKSIYSKLNSHCFNFIMNCIEPLLSSDFIFHDDNKQNINEKDNSEKIFYSFIPQKNLNTWIEINEPEVPELDRYLSIKTKIVKNSENSSLKNNIKDNEESNMIQKDNKEIPNRNINRIENKLNTLKETLEVDSYLNSKNNSKIELKTVDEKENNENENNINIIVNNEKKEKNRKNARNLIIDLPSYDLSKEVYEDKYILMNNNEENNLLRQEKEKEIMNKEQQKNLEKIQNKKEYEKLIKNKFIKEIDANKLTFDSNGNIINLNIPNIDTFSKEFTISKPIITDLKMENTNLLTNIKTPQKYLFNKQIKLNKYNSSDLTLNNNKKYIPKNSESKLEKKSSNKINFISKFKLLNPSFSLNSIIKHNKKSKIKIEYNTIGQEDKKINKKINIPPSGSNFEKIIPEVGVIVQNEDKNQVKKGGFEYYRKYNKPSISEFSQLVNETIKLNSQLISSSLTTGNINQKNKNNFGSYHSDYNGYNQELIDNNNPLIQNAVISISNIKTNNENNNSLINIKNLLEKNQSKSRIIFKSFDNKTNNFRNKNLSNLKLSKKILISDLSNFLSIQDEKDNDEEKDVKVHNKNIFKSLKRRSFSNYYGSSEKIIKNNKFYSLFSSKSKIYSPNKITELPNILNSKNNNIGNMELLGEDFINNFNSKILKNKNWGNNVFSERNTKIGQEIKNIFRKPKLNITNEYTIETRKRIPKNRKNYENNKIFFEIKNT